MTSILADNLQIWGFQNEFVIFSDGSYGFALELDPVDVSCWEDNRIDNFAGRICNFLNGLQPGINIQFAQEICGGNESSISGYGELLSKTADQTRADLVAARMSYLRKQDQLGCIPSHRLRCFVRRKPTSPLLQKPKFFSKTPLFQEVSEENFAKELNTTDQLRNDLIRSLSSLGITARSVEARKITELIYTQWNPSRKVPLATYDPEDIRSSLLFSDVQVYERGFSLGELHHRVVSLKLFPDQTYASMARVLRALPFDSKLFVTLAIPDQTKELEALQTQRRLAFSMARGKKSGVSDVESEAKLLDLEDLISQLVAQGEKVFYLSLNVLLTHKSEEILDEQVSQTLLTIRELSGAEGMEESLASFDIFSELSYPNASAKERSKRIKTSNVADLLPLYGPWPGHDTPRILLKSPQGTLVSIDPFSKELSNYNQIVAGGSGSGKSFLTNVLLLQMLKENPKVFVVDIGGSYKKLCENLSGQYIPFHLDTNVSLNPFDLLPGESAPSPQKIKFLVGLVEMMTKEEGESRIGRLERAEIEEAIEQVYRSNSTPRLSDLRAKLLAHNDDLIKRFGKILGPWCGNTPFGRMIDAPTTIALDRSVVCFDLKGLETFPDLQSVCLYIITDLVWREVQKDRVSKKFLVFDECWKLLESDAGADFMGGVFRTFRKYFASAIAISQNIDDFAKSKVAGAILSNTSLKWVLMQKGADQARLKEVLQLNDNEMALIASLHQLRGSYSQAFLMAEDKHSVVAIEPTPFEYWIATTDSRDLAVVDEKMKEEPHRPPIEILKKLANDYPKGVVASKEAL